MRTRTQRLFASIVAVAFTAACQKPATVEANEIIAIWGKLGLAVRVCESRSSVVDTLAQGEVVTAMDLVAVRRDCDDQNPAVADLTAPPSARGKLKTAFDDAIGACRSTLKARRLAASTGYDVLLGASPRAADDLKLQIKAAKAPHSKCIGDFYAATSDAGFNPRRILE